MAKPKVAALWCGGIMSATEARQMEMQEKAPREACRDTARLMRHQALSLRQLRMACCMRWSRFPGQDIRSAELGTISITPRAVRRLGILCCCAMQPGSQDTTRCLLGCHTVHRASDWSLSLPAQGTSRRGRSPGSGMSAAQTLGRRRTGRTAAGKASCHKHRSTAPPSAPVQMHPCRRQQLHD